MRFKIDENLSESTKEMIVDCGHDCHTVHEETLSGAPDERLIGICRDEKRHLITLDLDFADIVRYPPDHFAGIIVLRLSRQDPVSINQRLRAILPLIEGVELVGHLVIVTDTRIRYR